MACFLLALAVASSAGCAAMVGAGSPRGGEEEESTVVSGVASAVETTVGAAPETAVEEEAGAHSPEEEDDFVSEGTVSGGSGRGADAILGVRFGRHEDHERIVVDLGAGEAPAGEVPRWSVQRAPGDGLLRINVPSARSTVVSDGGLEDLGSSLLRGFYVVRAPDDGLFVDVLAEGDFTFRTMELRDPARLVVDFREADGELAVPPPEAAFNTVLVEPRSGDDFEGAITVSGYSRNPEAMNTVVLEDAEGRVLARRSVLANDWTATWGYFETTLDAPTFAGEGRLRAGAPSARDGAFQGVAVPVAGR